MTLYAFSKRGYALIMAYILIFLGLATVLYINWFCGIDLPQGLLTYALIIVGTEALIGPWPAFGLTTLISVIIFELGHRQMSHNFIPVYNWRDSSLFGTDLVVFIVTLYVILAVSWVSNVLIEQSLSRARRSEAALRRERDSLECRVEERTKELKETQAQEISQIMRLAEFGRVASGIFHDLANPLTAISLNLEQVKAHEVPELSETHNYVQQAIEATRKMSKLVEAIRGELHHREGESEFSLNKEINEALNILSYRAKRAHVQLEFKQEADIKLFGSAIKFHQIVTNLVINAIEACDGLRGSRELVVSISLEKVDDSIIVSVQDNGRGIEPKILERIFDPFFTTKVSKKGAGIGLVVIKDIVEINFSGSIKVESIKGEKTTFTVTLPYKELEDENQATAKQIQSS